MLNHIGDIDLLAASAIRVEHFATSNSLVALGSDPAFMVRAWMSAHDFDIAPVKDAQTFSFVARADLLTLAPEEQVSVVAQPVDPCQLVDPSLPLLDVLALLATRGWFFVKNGDASLGIVTRHDLARPAVSLYLFAKIISLEQGLRRLLGSYTSSPIPDAPLAEAGPGDPHYLSAVLKQVRRVPALCADLGFKSGNDFDKGTGFINELRNHLAHGRTVLDLELGAYQATERIQKIDALLRKVHALVREREQVWSAYATTHILHRRVTVIEKVWSGPDAIDLPMPVPVHVLTACNPFEQVLSTADNERRNSALLELLEARGLQIERVFGRSADGDWVEPSFAVHGLTTPEACEIARLFGQRAIFELDEGVCRVISIEGRVRAESPRSS